MQPPGFSAAAWHAVYGNLTAQLGNTWGGYVQMLDNEAAYLGHLGENVTDVGRLWGFAVAQADNALLPVSQYSTTTDIGLPSPGNLSLEFHPPGPGRHQRPVCFRPAGLRLDRQLAVFPAPSRPTVR